MFWYDEVTETTLMNPQWLWIDDFLRDHWAYRIHPGLLTIGRAPTSDIWLVHNTVSRSHATITTLKSRCILRDVGSGNGTFLNGIRVSEERAIHPGDRIQLGAIQLLVVVDIEVLAKKNFEDGSTREMVGSRKRTQQRAKGLTPGQRRVLHWLVRGLTEKQIACELGITFHTVHSHVKAIHSILEVQSRTELLAKLAGIWDWQQISGAAP